MDTIEKKKKINMVVCDMAGTTIDENNIVYKTLHDAINQFGYDVSLRDVLSLGAGKEKKQAIESITHASVGNVSSARIDAIFEAFLKRLETNYQIAEITAQNNAEEFFVALKKRGIIVVLNTGYDRKTAETLMNKLGWTVGQHIDALITADDVTKSRPHPDMIFLAMEKFAIPSGESVAKVGDSQIDIAEGQQAACGLSIGITTGAHTVEQLEAAKPDFIVDNLMDILPLLD